MINGNIEGDTHPQLIDWFLIVDKCEVFITLVVTTKICSTLI